MCGVKRNPQFTLLNHMNLLLLNQQGAAQPHWRSTPAQRRRRVRPKRPGFLSSSRILEHWLSGTRRNTASFFLRSELKASEFSKPSLRWRRVEHQNALWIMIPCAIDATNFVSGFRQSQNVMQQTPKKKMSMLPAHFFVFLHIREKKHGRCRTKGGKKSRNDG